MSGEMWITIFDVEHGACAILEHTNSTKLAMIDSGHNDTEKWYLLFRDLAAMSLMLFLASPALAFSFDWRVAGWAALLFAAQTVLCAVTSRNTGIRFVTNVLVLHSAKDAPKPRAKKAAAKAAAPASP